MTNNSVYTRTTPELFTGVLTFANWRDLPVRVSNADSRRLREALRFYDDALEPWPRGLLVSADRIRWRAEEPAVEQRRLAGALSHLIERGASRELAAGLQEQVAAVRMTAHGALREVPPRDHPPDRVYRPRRGTKPTLRFDIAAIAYPATLAEWYSLALAEILTLDVQLGQCALPTCQRFFVCWRSRGPRREFCTTGHASQARVKRKRQRDKRT